MSTVKVQNQHKGLVFQAQVMVLQETRQQAVQGLDILEKAIAGKEFQKLSAEQRSALREVRTLLVDLKPKDQSNS
jgi:hypothetical protein